MGTIHKLGTTFVLANGIDGSFDIRSSFVHGGLWPRRHKDEQIKGKEIVHMIISPHGDIGVGTAKDNLFVLDRQPGAKLHVLGGTVRPRAFPVTFMTSYNREITGSDGASNFLADHTGARPGELMGIAGENGEEFRMVERIHGLLSLQLDRPFSQNFTEMIAYSLRKPVFRV